MRVAIFGGTFDPVHLGHLIMAEQCRDQADLDEVWFVPAARPPHKLDAVLTPFGRRVEMLSLALAGHPAFRIEELEKDRQGPSYTADTMQELATRHPDHDWHFVMGSDSLPDLPGWHEPTRILNLTKLLVVARPGSPILSGEQLGQQLRLPEAKAIRMQMVESPLIEIASRDVRRRVGEGRSIRYLVPRAVECYIQDKKLYRTEGV